LSTPPRNHPRARRGFPSPNIRPKPTAKKAIEATANTMKFLARMFTAFLAWHSPVSSVAKPAFMKNTRQAATTTHKVSRATLA
jgi:hypothetical protein